MISFCGYKYFLRSPVIFFMYFFSSEHFLLMKTRSCSFVLVISEHTIKFEDLRLVPSASRSPVTVAWCPLIQHRYFFWNLRHPPSVIFFDTELLLISKTEPTNDGKAPRSPIPRRILRPSGRGGRWSGCSWPPPLLRPTEGAASSGHRPQTIFVITPLWEVVITHQRCPRTSQGVLGRPWTVVGAWLSPPETMSGWVWIVFRGFSSTQVFQAAAREVVVIPQSLPVL